MWKAHVEARASRERFPLGKHPFVFFVKHLQPGPMQTARRSQTTDRPRKRHDRKRDASNFDDYMLAVVSVALVGFLIAL